MVFVPPSWFWGGVMWSVYHVIPALIGLVILIYGHALTDEYDNKSVAKGVGLMIIGFILCTGMLTVGGDYLWHEQYEVPSVQEKIITVQEWQPNPNIQPNENGIISINSANDLMLITTDQEIFENTETMWFNKFETRDIFNQLKVNGTYKIKYYGWRNGYNNGFPNIISVEKVIDESNASPNKYSDYFGARLSMMNK